MELLVTTSLMAMVGAAIVASLFGGIRVFQRATEYGSGEQAAMVMFDGLRRDLEGIRRFAPAPFEGKYEAVAFAAVGKDVTGDEQPDEIGRLSYYVDSRSRMLCRRFVPYRLSRRSRASDSCHPILDNVARVRFEYFGAPEEGSEPAWARRWDGKEIATLPTAVKIEVTVMPSGRKEVTRSFVVYVPGKVGGEETEKGDGTDSS